MIQRQILVSSAGGPLLINYSYELFKNEMPGILYGGYRYTAIELFNSHSKATEESDVWALGMVIWVRKNPRFATMFC